jgi:hypothetical protein
MLWTCVSEMLGGPLGPIAFTPVPVVEEDFHRETRGGIHKEKKSIG